LHRSIGLPRCREFIANGSTTANNWHRRDDLLFAGHGASFLYYPNNVANRGSMCNPFVRASCLAIAWPGCSV
jgi:hypothetical protein